MLLLLRGGIDVVAEGAAPLEIAARWRRPGLRLRDLGVLNRMRFCLLWRCAGTGCEDDGAAELRRRWW